MASSLTKYLMVTNFRKNPRGSGFFCVEMTWNDPLAFLAGVSYSDTPAVNLEAETSTSKPLSVLLVTGLYPGHLFPLVSLGEELVRRGHNVTLCANVMRGSHLYPDVPERVGIKFVSAGYDELYTQDLFEEVHAINSFNLTIMKSILRIYLSSYIQIRSKVEEMGIDHFDIIVSEVVATPVAVSVQLRTAFMKF